MLRKIKKGHISSVDPKKGRLGSEKRKEHDKKTKAAAKKRAANPRKPPKPSEETSITRGIYRLFQLNGPDLTTLDMCIEVAKAIKPDTKFDRWHLYYHRKIYKQLVAANEDPFNPIGIRPKGEVIVPDDDYGTVRLDRSKAPKRDIRGKIIKQRAGGRQPLKQQAKSGPKTLAEFYEEQMKLGNKA